MVEGRKAVKTQKVVKKYEELLKKVYSIIELLSASGGFATVLKGKNIGLDRWEAIKAIDVDFIEDAGLTLEKVEQEITMLAKLDHKHIVRVFNRIRETTEEWDYIFMIMELCDSTLVDILNEFPDGVPKGKARELLKQIVKGVEYLHSQEIIHRDLKPGNIFLKEGQVKIGDFNISKEIGIGSTTRPSQMFLTYDYAPPERAVYQRPGDKRVDIWSIGVIYYILLQGQLPFTGDTHEELLRNIGNICYSPLTKGDDFDFEVIRMCLLPENDRADITQLKDFIIKGPQPIMPKVICMYISIYLYSSLERNI